MLTIPCDLYRMSDRDLASPLVQPVNLRAGATQGAASLNAVTAPIPSDRVFVLQSLCVQFLMHATESLLEAFVNINIRQGTGSVHFAGLFAWRTANAAGLVGEGVGARAVGEPVCFNRSVPNLIVPANAEIQCNGTKSAALQNCTFELQAWGVLIPRGQVLGF